LDIRDRKWMLKSYPRCFVGSECVSYLLARKHAATREDAVALGQMLVDNNIIAHVTKDHGFKDGTFFYRFKDHDKKKKRVGDDEVKLEVSSWIDLMPGSPGKDNLLPDIPFGFVDESMEDIKYLEKLEVAPLDEHNLKLLDNVHPPSWKDPLSDGTYNMVAIGAGAGGLVTAAGSAGVGAKVAIIEMNLLGGDCLNYGCVPSKALLRVAKTISEVRHAGQFGVHIEGEVKIDFPAIMERMRKLRADISPNDSAKRFEDLGIDVFIGEAKFIGKDSICVNNQTLKFRRACIATGAKAAVPKIPGLSSISYLTNETIFNLTELPKSMIVVGSGAIGCEMAQCFACFGTTVYLTARSGKILGREEVEASEIVAESLTNDGVHILTNCTYHEFTSEEETGMKVLRVTRNGEEELIKAECVLLAVGRSPNVSSLNLEEAGVKYDTREGIKVNDQLVTSNKRIFAVGDCCTKYKFTHVADFMARIVIRNALFFGNAKFSDLVIPWATYTKPELAHVGLYEEDMKKRNLEYDVFEKHFEDVDRAILDGDKGYIKVITKKGSDKIVGCTIVGSRAGDMISEVTLAITNGLGLGAIALTIHPYPTESECIRQVGDLFNRTRLTPTVKVLFRKLLSARRTTKI